MGVLLRLHHAPLVNASRVYFSVKLPHILGLSCWPLWNFAKAGTASLRGTILPFKLNLGRTKYRCAFSKLLGIASCHNLVILILKFNLLYGLPLYAIQQRGLKLLQFLHLFDILHDILLLELHLPLILHVLNFRPLLHPRLILLCLRSDGTLEHERLLPASRFRVAFVTDFNVGEVVAVGAVLAGLGVAYDLVFPLLGIADLLDDYLTLFLFFLLFLQVEVLLPAEDLLRPFSVSDHLILGRHELLLAFFDVHHLLETSLFLDFTFMLGLFTQLHHGGDFVCLCLVSFLDAFFLQLEKLDSVLHLS